MSEDHRYSTGMEEIYELEEDEWDPLRDMRSALDEAEYELEERGPRPEIVRDELEEFRRAKQALMDHTQVLYGQAFLPSNISEKVISYEKRAQELTFRLIDMGYKL